MKAELRSTLMFVIEARQSNFWMLLLLFASTISLQVLRDFQDVEKMWGCFSVFCCFSHHCVQLGRAPPAGLGPDQPRRRCYFCLLMQTPSLLHSRPLKEQGGGHLHLVLRGAQQMSNDLRLREKLTWTVRLLVHQLLTMPLVWFVAA